jgi:lipopolysaccharide transport system ATP-binding protein
MPWASWVKNGSGKSTLLQLIAGVYPPSEGSVRTAGRVAALLELGSGFDPEYTGRNNIYMYGAVLGLSRSQIDERYDDIVGFADIGGFIDQPVRTYSSGMFVRLAFAVAIHVDAQVLIVDEALSVGDARFAAKCMKRIEKLREDGVTLLFVSHDVGAVRAVCERALWLQTGVTRATGPVREVTARYTEYLFGDDGAGDGQAPEAATAASRDGVEHSRRAAAQHMDLGGSINHWGARKGLVLDVALSGREGVPGSYQYGEEMDLSVRLRLPPGIPTDALSVAFSLKDIKGSDLMVAATHEEQPGLFRGLEGDQQVDFRFPMRLTAGQYMLVIAVEDRSGPVIDYHEYIEGVIFFAVTAEPTRYGIFNLPVEIGVQPA